MMTTEERVFDVLSQCLSFHAPEPVDSFSFTLETDMRKTFNGIGNRFMWSIKNVHEHFSTHFNMSIDMVELEPDNIFDILPTFHHTYLYCLYKLTNKYDELKELAELVNLDEIEDIF
jgi:hypothetical protein